MRVDLPTCNFKNCKYNVDYNCTKPNEYKVCSRGNIFTLAEKLYENIRTIKIYGYCYKRL